MKPLSMSKQGDNNNNNDKLYSKQSLPHVTRDFFSKNGPGSTLKKKKNQAISGHRLPWKLLQMFFALKLHIQNRLNSLL